MGGPGSGRRDGRPLADASLWIDIAMMIRTGRAVPGACVSGKLRWESNGRAVGTVAYHADMSDPDNSLLHLVYRRQSGDGMETVTQSVRLVYTVPPCGGRRWWMMCPEVQVRVGKLYLPAGADHFASRQAWRLGYRCQRVGQSDKPLGRLFALQQKLGGLPGWGKGLHRPKGMWQRTFERHLERYRALDHACLIEAGQALGMSGLEHFH